MLFRSGLINKNMKKIIVFGAGLVGSAIAIDIKKTGKFQIVSSDVSAEPLQYLNKKFGINILQFDAGNKAEL